MPGADLLEGVPRAACPFEAFFSCEAGTTPQELLRKGIYSRIAIALKCGPWRRASLVIFAHAFHTAENFSSKQSSDAARLSLLARLGYMPGEARFGTAFEVSSDIIPPTILSPTQARAPILTMCRTSRWTGGHISHRMRRQQLSS
eukprot:3939642-Prymnesium_polylepis.1